jgi:hypothetical protein
MSIVSSIVICRIPIPTEHRLSMVKRWRAGLKPPSGDVILQLDDAVKMVRHHYKRIKTNMVGKPVPTKAEIDLTNGTHPR